MKIRTTRLAGILILAFFVFSVSVALAQEKPIKAELPVLLTSCGQSPGPMTVKVIMERRAKIKPIYNLQATAADLLSHKESGKPIKSLIIVTGASLKGMGAAGISIDDELARTKVLLAEAKKQGITIIGAHVEGMKRRAQGAEVGDNTDELSIDAVCPNSDILLIKEEGDEDGRFTTISKDKKIPMLSFKMNRDLIDVVKNLFSK